MAIRCEGDHFSALFPRLASMNFPDLSSNIDAASRAVAQLAIHVWRYPKTSGMNLSPWATNDHDHSPFNRFRSIQHDGGRDGKHRKLACHISG